MGNEMKTTERVENAFRRIKELLTLVADWTKKQKEPDALSLEFNKKKQQMIDDLYVQLGALSDRYHFSNKKEFSTKEYIVQYDQLKKKITDLEK
tara:strand:+ start:1725 stop:2006 length:282 start_codon:yes stop_codon:yes gene_type:complete